MSLQSLLQPFRSNRRMALIASAICLSVMMYCLGITFYNLAIRMLPDWHGQYFPWWCAALTLETIVSRSIIRERSGSEKWIYIASELVLIALMLKIMLYAFNGLDSFWRDISTWESSMESFFSGEFTLLLLISIFIWWLAGQVFSDLEGLHSDEDDYFAESAGLRENNRLEIRERLAEMLFSIGMGLTFLTALTRFELPKSIGIPQAVNAPVVNVVVYFLLALVLLSQSQFALLNGRWLWQHTPVSPTLAKNWIAYSLIFFVLVSAIALLLPTSYTLGLLRILQDVILFLSQIFLFVLTVLMFPFAWLLSLVNPNTKEAPASPKLPTLPSIVENTPTQSLPWLQVVRALLFWLVVFGIAGYAIRIYYLRNREALRAIRFPLLRWMVNQVHGWWDWLRFANHQVGQAISQQIQRLRGSSLTGIAERSESYLNPRSLPTRQRILFFYLSLLRRSSQEGLARKQTQTPYQYRAQLEKSLPDLEPEIDALTDSFVEARYSRHEISEDQAERVQGFWKRLMTSLRNWQNRRKNG